MLHIVEMDYTYMPKEAEENWCGEIKYVLISGAFEGLDDDKYAF